MANVSEGSDFVDVNGNRRHIYSYLRFFILTRTRLVRPKHCLAVRETVSY
jgi:ATP-binding cassette subfamily F protein uup